MDSVVVGIVRNVYNWLSYGIVGNSVCRMWESCSLAFPCSVNRVIHDSIVLSVKLDAPAPCRLDAPDLDLIYYASADCLHQHLQVI